ncbi:MAG: ferredoxin [Candidatus Gracilibacteria bacterium]|nr:ferredoxin [Candidatus Gracilibacteria bacterium]
MTQIDPIKVASAATALKRKPIVSNACIGCGACVAISGDVFELNDDGISIVLELPDYEGKDVDDSIIACPVNAISWEK